MRKEIGDFREHRMRQQIGDMGNLDKTTRTKLGADFATPGNRKVGIGGASGQGSFAGSLRGSIENDAKLDTVLGTATNAWRAFADATYGGQGSFQAGASGRDAQGTFGARAGIGASTQGRLENALGPVNHQDRVAAEVCANADGQAKLDARCLQPKVHGEIGARAVAEGKADFYSAGIDLGGE
jgi:hypothetical protein